MEPRDAEGHVLKEVSPAAYDAAAGDGRLTQVTDPEGHVQERRAYDLHGNMTGRVNAAGAQELKNRFRFCGEMQDPISRQYYLRARYYNPVIGRFIQEDTYRRDGLNLYAYCANSPVNYVDPGGHCGEKKGNPFADELAGHVALEQEFAKKHGTTVYYDDARSQGINKKNSQKTGPELMAEAANAAKGTDAGTDPVIYLEGGSNSNPRLKMDLQYFADKGGSDTMPDPYVGVKKASKYLKDIGLPRNVRKDILESFDVRTINVEQAGSNTYGLRFYGGNAKANGPYLFETFTQQTNRANLALPPEWNSMTGIKQWKILEGTTMFTGNAAPQLQYGSQYVGGAKQIWVPNPKQNLIG